MLPRAVILSIFYPDWIIVGLRQLNRPLDIISDRRRKFQRLVRKHL